MATSILNSRVQFKNDSSTNWTTRNPILLKGEVGIETDTGKSKYGDGVTAWKGLAYSKAGDADTVDGKHASNTANNVPVLDANAKLPLAQIPTGTSATTVALGNHTHSYSPTEHNHDSVYVKPNAATVANRIATFSDTTGRTIKDSGFTIATSVPANAVFTDTNTWRGVQNNLTSTAADQSLAAAQGKVLKELVDAKLPLVGGTISGNLKVNGTLTGTLTGNASSATKLTTARTISLGTGASGTATSFDGSANITIPVTAVKESYLSWGGKDFSGSYGCIDAAMIPDLGSNRLMFVIASAITVEYSRDGGATWLDYGASDTSKMGLFSTGSGFTVGKSNNTTDKPNANCQLRVTLNTGVASVYTTLNKFCVYVSTNGSSNCTCTIEKALESTPTVFVTEKANVPVSGWSGYNIINTGGITTYGNSPANQYGRIRFTFKIGGHTNETYSGLSVSRIMGFGGVGWNTPSNMARMGHLYSFDVNQNATFPAAMSSSQITSRATTGTAPLVVSSTTAVANLNADLLDGKHASNTANNVPVLDSSAKIPIAQIPTGTSSTTVSLGNHNHDSSYVKPTGTIVVNRVATFSDTTGRVIKDSGFTIGTSVPAGAKFTDTTYTAFSTNSSGLVPAPGSAGANKFLKGNGTWAEMSVKGIHTGNTPPTDTAMMWLDTSGSDGASAVNFLSLTDNVTGRIYNLQLTNGRLELKE